MVELYDFGEHSVAVVLTDVLIPRVIERLKCLNYFDVSVLNSVNKTNLSVLFSLIQ